MGRILAIVGAGATKDVWNGSSPITNRRSAGCEPPLARELFAGSNYFWKIAQHYPGAQVLGSISQPLTKKPNFNLEAKLRECADSPNPEMKRHFLDVPPYLRHLIQAIEAEYVQTPGSYLQFITELVGISGHELFILTTNYDTYIESALRMFSPKTYVYSSIQDYVRPDRQVRLAKLHGSTNWGYPFHEAYESDVSGSPWPERWIERVQYLRLPLDSRRTIIDDGKATGPAWFAKDGTRTTFLYPVLTAPLAGKDEPSLVCPEEHIIAAREFMSIPHTVLVLGSSGLDDDVLALLSNNSTNITRAKVVTKDDAPAVAERFARALGMAVEDIACYDLGFSTWMANQDFRQFADSA